MLTQANSVAQFQMMVNDANQRQLMAGNTGLVGGMPGMNSFGMDSYGGSMFGMNPMMSSGIPFGGFGMNTGFSMSMTMGFGSFQPAGFGGGMMGGFGVGQQMGMNPQMLMMMLMMCMMGGGMGMGQTQGTGYGQPYGYGQNYGYGQPAQPTGAGAYAGINPSPSNVKITEGNPEKWYFQHGKHEVTDWKDANGKKIGHIDEGGDTRIYYNTESQTGYIYKKVEANSSVKGPDGTASSSTTGWQLVEIREKWGGKSASPIMLDLDGSGTPDVQNGEWRPHAEQGDLGGQKVLFDLDGDGRKELTEWTGGKDGLLLKLSDAQIAEYKKTGKLEVSGRELYGDQGGQYADGYEKMRQLSDANQDGKLSGAELENHYTWQDTNKDGIVDAGELATVQDKGITSVNATHGGDFQSSFTMNGQERKTWDWWPTTW